MATYKDAHHRSILKALSWRVLATLATILIVFAFTRKIVLSVGVGAVEVVIKLILYYLHERMWGHWGVGRKEHPLASLPVEKALEDKDMQIIKEKLKDLGYISED
jgi:adenylylsulfate kinase